MNNVVSINAHVSRFPIGALVNHPKHGLCDVTDISPSGAQRTIRWIIQVPDEVLNLGDLPSDVLPEEVLSSATIVTHFADVDAHELTRLDMRQENEFRFRMKDLTIGLGLLN